MRTTTFRIAGPSRPRVRVSEVVSARVVVHFWSEASREWYFVTDPVSGRYYRAFRATQRDAAIRWARRLVQRFGANPLRGSIQGRGGAWVRKPRRYQELRAFVGAR